METVAWCLPVSPDQRCIFCGHQSFIGGEQLVAGVRPPDHDGCVRGRAAFSYMDSTNSDSGRSLMCKGMRTAIKIGQLCV
jgi:hypothetical protein